MDPVQTFLISKGNVLQEALLLFDETGQRLVSAFVPQSQLLLSMWGVQIILIVLSDVLSIIAEISFDSAGPQMSLLHCTVNT